MPRRPTVGRKPSAAKLAVPLALMLAGPQARAVDGCLVLLCLAAPSWRAISQCVPPIRQLFRDLRHGRPFPTCHMSGPDSYARHRWASAPGNCPPQYTHEVWAANGPRYRCDWRGAISVHVDGQFWSRTWWDSEDSVTEFGNAANVRLPEHDTRFDDDFARWRARRAADGLICDGC